MKSCWRPTPFQRTFPFLLFVGLHLSLEILVVFIIGPFHTSTTKVTTTAIPVTFVDKKSPTTGSIPLHLSREDEEDPLERVFSPWITNQDTSTTTSTNKNMDNEVQLLLLPMFWHIPKSGGTSVKQLAKCLGLVGVHQGSDKQSSESTTSSTAIIQMVEQPAGQYMVNVDVSSRSGIQNAHQRGFSQFLDRFAQERQNNHSGYYSFGCSTSGNRGAATTNVLDLLLATPWLHDALCGLLPPSGGGNAVDNNNDPALQSQVVIQGALLSLFRHPVDRAVSLFYYLQHADWEPTYRPELANMTLLELYTANRTGTTTTNIPVERNWMTYYLALEGRQNSKQNAGIPRKTLMREDLEYAKRLLDQKFLVGLTDQMGESLRRFGWYFGWQNQTSESSSAAGTAGDGVNKNRWHECRTQVVEHGANAFDHPRLEMGSRCSCQCL